jgi:hypothetical protein
VLDPLQFLLCYIKTKIIFPYKKISNVYKRRNLAAKRAICFGLWGQIVKKTSILDTINKFKKEPWTTPLMSFDYAKRKIEGL